MRMSRLFANCNNKLKRVQIVTIYTAYDIMQWVQCNTTARRSIAKFTKTTVYADQLYNNNNNIMQLFSSHCSCNHYVGNFVIGHEYYNNILGFLFVPSQYGTNVMNIMILSFTAMTFLAEDIFDVS